MPCYRPIEAWRREGGGITWAKRESIYSVKLPCGQCIGCRVDRSRMWAARCMHEAQEHARSCFVTLTYSDDNLPSDGSLNKRHFQLFLKRLRKAFPDRRISYFHAGEYGDETGRPHYHAILFGVDFHEDAKIWRKDSKLGNLYSSERLESLWGLGLTSFGDVTFSSCAYVARYCIKKVNNQKADLHYQRVDLETGEIIQVQPEYMTCSTNPAIGKSWFQRYQSDVFPDDFLVVAGKKIRVPKYYDKLLKRSQADKIELVKKDRQKRAFKHAGNNTKRRLAVRETVHLDKLKLLKRGL